MKIKHKTTGAYFPDCDIPDGSTMRGRDIIGPDGQVIIGGLGPMWQPSGDLPAHESVEARVRRLEDKAAETAEKAVK